MRAIPTITALVVALIVAAGPSLPAAAQQEEQDGSPGALAGEAMDKLMQALDLLLGSIPQYEAPYVNEDGDIIIRRKRDELPTPEEKPASPADQPDTTTT